MRTTAQTSPLVEPMKDLVEMYEALNRAFPYSDYVTLKQNEVCYWVNRSMRPEYDFLGTLEKLKPMIEKLKSLPSKGKKTIALVSIRDAVVIEGVLPRVLLHRVLGWCVSHTKELLADWNLARQGKEPKWIDWTID